MDLLAQFYGLFFLGIGLIYVSFYLIPLVQGLRSLRLTGLDKLVVGVRSDLDMVTTEGRPDRANHDGNSSYKPLSRDDVQAIADAYTEGHLMDDIREDYDIEYWEWVEIRDRHELKRGERTVIGSAEEQEEITSDQRWAAERLSRLGSLRASYSGVVQEAVDQVHSQYPDGAYQRFEIERLPTVAAFSERVGAARTMAGLFVLLGLFFTMIRLNGVVGAIAAAAGGSTMDPAAFLETMGGLMDGIGGAFDSSIIGLGLLVLALLVIGAIDWVAQRRVLTLESEVTHRVIPPLSDLHDRLSPNLTLADLLAETGAHLERLGSTVGGLTSALDVSLSKLGDRIGRMMDDFGSFQEQYDSLDSLLKHMRIASEGLAGVSAKLDGAAARVADPLTGFNKSLLRHVETVADWIEVSRDGFNRLGREMEIMREHSDRMVEGLARASEDGFGEALRDHRGAIAAIETQAVGIQHRLTALTGALDRVASSGDGAPSDDR